MSLFPKMPVILAIGSAWALDAVHEAFSRVDSLDVLGGASNLEELRSLAKIEAEHILLLGAALPGLDSLETIMEIDIIDQNTLLVLVVRQDYDIERVNRLRQFSPRAIVPADIRMTELIKVVELVSRGLTVFPPDRWAEYESTRPQKQIAKTDFHLSQRERDMLALLAEGLSEKEVAVRLNIGIRTVHTYIERVRAKLGAKNRVEAIVRAIRTDQIAFD